MDTRDTPTSDSAYIYASYSDNGGVTWSTNQRISNQKMKINCSTCGGGGTPRYQGDYDAIVSTDNQAMMMWTDFRFGDFGSYVAYFPDFAMKVSPSNSIIENDNDSAFVNINVASVKLYNSTAIFSANLAPTPPRGTFVIDFPQGNTLSSFPGSVTMRVRTSGNVSHGNYTINIKGEGPNGTPVHRRTASIQVVGPALDFGVNLLVLDNCINQVPQSMWNTVVILPLLAYRIRALRIMTDGTCLAGYHSSCGCRGCQIACVCSGFRARLSKESRV